MSDRTYVYAVIFETNDDEAESVLLGVFSTHEKAKQQLTEYVTREGMDIIDFKICKCLLNSFYGQFAQRVV